MLRPLGKSILVAAGVVAALATLATLFFGNEFVSVAGGTWQGATPPAPAPGPVVPPPSAVAPKGFQRAPESVAEPPPAETPPGPGIIVQRVGPGALDMTQSADSFLQFDSDRNGVVDRGEAGNSEFLNENFDAIDLDRDGTISAQEMRAFDARRLAGK